MNKIILTLMATLAGMAIQLSSAATIPAGTTLVVRTSETLASNDPVGKTFRAQLGQDLAVRGNVVLRAGAAMTGRVDSRRTQAFTSVILNVTELTSNGRLIPIRTVAGFRADSTQFRSRSGRSVGRGGFFHIPAGTIMRFELAQPVNLTSGRR